jgi:hypothetical protein
MSVLGGQDRQKTLGIPVVANTETMKHGEKKEYFQPAPKTQLGG